MKTIVVALAFAAAFLLLFGCASSEQPPAQNGQPQIGPSAPQTGQPPLPPAGESIEAEQSELDEQDATLEDSIADLEVLK